MGPKVSACAGPAFAATAHLARRGRWCWPHRLLWTGVALCCPLVAIAIRVSASVNSAAWDPLPVAQVGGTSRVLDAALPTPVWCFSHLTGSGGGSLDRRRPVFSYWLLPRRGPVTLVVASPAPHCVSLDRRSLLAQVTLSTPGSSATSKHASSSPIRPLWAVPAAASAFSMSVQGRTVAS